MADNVLSGVVRITAPGAQQAFSEIASGTQKAEANLKGLGTTATKTTGVVRQLVPVVGDLSLNLKDQRVILASLQKQFASLNTQQAKSAIGRELAADIKIANAEIKRLEAGATSSFGKIGQSATKGFSAIRQLAFILPGLGIAGIFNLAFTAIESVVNELFNLGRGFKDGEVAAALFKQALDDISDSAEKLKSRLDFQDDIAKLKASIAGLKGEDLDIFDLGNRTKSAVELITAEQKISDALKEQRDQIAQVADGYIKAGLASSKFVELATIAASGRVIPKTLVSQLTGPREKSVADAYIAIVEKIVESDKRSSAAQSTIGKNFLETQQDQQKKQEEILKKRSSNYESFVSETIAQAKKLDSAFKDVINITPNFSVLDTKQEEFKKASDFLKQFKDGTFKITLKPELDDKEFKEAINLFGKTFKTSKLDIILPIEFPIDPKVIPETQAEINRILREIADFKPETADLKFDFSLEAAVKVDELKKKLQELTATHFGITLDDKTLDPALQKLIDIQKATQVTADTLINTLTPAFEDLFNSIASGGDGLKSFFDALKNQVQQLITKLVAAAVAAAILAALIPGDIGFLKIFGKLLGFEKGGRPPVGKPSIVGEKGPEIFVPDRPGVIVPNHKVKDFQQLGKPGKLTRISTKKEFYHDREVNKAVAEISKELVRVISDSISTIRETNNIQVKESTNLISKLIDRSQVFKGENVSHKTTPVSDKVDRSELSKVIKDQTKLKSELVSFSDKTKTDKSVSSKTEHTTDFSRETFTNSTLLKTLSAFHSSATVKELSKIIQSLKTDKVYRLHTIEISNLVRSSTNHTNTISEVLKHFTNQIGFRAAGGPVGHNKPFIVGENGPELFIPKRAGKIIPNHKITKNVFNQVKNNRSIVGGTRNVFNNRSTTNKKNNVFNRKEDKFFNSIVKNNSLSKLSNVSNTRFGGFRQGGGSVVAGSSFIVGERGLEIFVPNTGQSIVNNNTTGASGLVSGGTLKVEGNIRIAGKDLIAVIANTKNSQRNLV